MVVGLMLDEVSLKFYSIADWSNHFYFYSRMDEIDVEFFSPWYHGNRVVMTDKTEENMHTLIWSLVVFLEKIRRSRNLIDRFLIFNLEKWY